MLDPQRPYIAILRLARPASRVLARGRTFLSYSSGQGRNQL
jgi:hypothetical protein